MKSITLHRRITVPVGQSNVHSLSQRCNRSPPPFCGTKNRSQSELPTSDRPAAQVKSTNKAISPSYHHSIVPPSTVSFIESLSSHLNRQRPLLRLATGREHVQRSHLLSPMRTSEAQPTAISLNQRKRHQNTHPRNRHNRRR